MNQNQSFDPLVIDGKTFEELYSLDISDKVKTRPSANFDAKFLSWSHAYRLLKQHLPEVFVNFEVNPEGGATFTHGEESLTVRPYLTNGKQRTPAIHFPVMDYKFGALPRPDAREISDAMVRGAVKAIATFTGLGLSLYANEDTEVNQAVNRTAPQKNQAPIRQGDGEIIYLEKLPFQEKDQAKQLGARWDGERKKWYINTKFVDPKDFAKWLDGEPVEAEPVENSEPENNDPDLDEDVPF